MAWFTAKEALAFLQVQPQTLYANVSRGRIRAKPDPGDSRRSLYNADDVKRMASRQTGRRSVAAVAAKTMAWGDPVLSSSITTVDTNRLWYRGQDAVALSHTHTLEQIASLLWQVDTVSFNTPARIANVDVAFTSPLARAMQVLVPQIDTALPSRGRATTVLVNEAMSVIGTLIAAMLGHSETPGMPLHRRIAQAWDVPEAEDILRRTLVLLADHELNASAFAVRVAISTGASIPAGLMAGLTALTGPLHGSAVKGVRALKAQAQQQGVMQSVRDHLQRGDTLPAFGHPLYPHGDARAAALLQQFSLTPVYQAISEAGEEISGEKPNIDFVLSALAETYALPSEAPVILFALARSVGWVAHALEQKTTGQLIRPRANYVGEAVQA
ncbi:citrate synthase [Pseudomonas sp. 7P_10.2_Bac1]|uniref:citrate synthase n=1 Tax=Pseudomonas sp. 7P_10.2_Bac1 TaxID=2971614 RepID=UPI0021C9BB0C|nr:citrate synthase [Pseudomonas sp. 7P_10.2_Bac1]MCU1726952.1 citrate synthase [Pseudomonas sp. 7P_10.2_Bac1]